MVTKIKLLIKQIMTVIKTIITLVSTGILGACFTLVLFKNYYGYILTYCVKIWYNKHN